MQLPTEPGLRRRLAYGESLRRTRTFVQHRPLFHFDTNHFVTNHFVTNHFVTNKEEDGLNLKNLIKNSKIIIYKYNFFCSICQEDNMECQNYNFDKKQIEFEKNRNNKLLILRELVCQHSFHIECIEKWLSTNKSCPMCRKSLDK